VQVAEQCVSKPGGVAYTRMHSCRAHQRIGRG